MRGCKREDQKQETERKRGQPSGHGTTMGAKRGGRERERERELSPRIHGTPHGEGDEPLFAALPSFLYVSSHLKHTLKGEKGNRLHFSYSFSFLS